ncbi:glutamyl-tRNA amidotransferase subunit A [Chaetomium sp. MPI-SDFR-AT-0129]|nr:glutamyl-tRNA amidotransferase subunit A [Chaetomium sp. MPI-SDFR-AT-0129]
MDRGQEPLPSLAKITTDDIGRGLDDNRFTVVSLVEAHLARIKEVNDVFNAVLETNPDALAIAHELDSEIKERGRRGPLHGVPILVKDNICTNDGMATSAGSFAFLGSSPPREATVISRLRRAGAVILGKTNLSEFANFRSTDATNGWSPRGGQTWGAYIPGQASEGSSSGSGVAMALGLAPGSLGTETDGSIVMPSQKNNVVGFRQTTGLVPRDGVIPLSDRQDTVGPMARTVKDAAHILTAIAGESPYDDATHSIPLKSIPDYSQACSGSNLSGLRLGVPRRAIPSANPVVLAEFDKAVKKLASLGATVVEDVEIPSQDEWDAWNPAERRRALEAEFKASINRWCGSLVTNPQGIKTLDDLIDFVKEDPREAFPERNIERLLGAQASPGVDAGVTKNALKKLLRCCADEGISAALKRNNLDALVFPNEDVLPSTYAARAGFPVFAIPLGFYPSGTAIKKTEGDQIDIAPNIPLLVIPYNLTFILDRYITSIIYS